MKSASTKKPIPGIGSIAIIDSRIVYRKGLQSTLQDFFTQAEIHEADSLEVLVSRSFETVPDIVLFGGNQHFDYNHISELLKTNYPESKTIIYCSKSTIININTFLNKRINGYITDDFDEDELKHCLLEISKGRNFISSALVWEFFNKISFQHSNKRVEKLSKSEDLVATLLIEGKSVSWIAQKTGRNISTISTQKANIFRKMQVNNVIDLARVFNS